jgi:hypothetical protein
MPPTPIGVADRKKNHGCTVPALPISAPIPPAQRTKASLWRTEHKKWTNMFQARQGDHSVRQYYVFLHSKADQQK